MLEMKNVCDLCETRLAMDREAFICSFECTFCPGCSAGMARICPNCGGELCRRPRRRTKGNAS